MNLRQRLENPDLLVSSARIGGEWVAATEGCISFEVTNPSTGEVIASVPNLDRDWTARAIDSAHLAQSEWARKTGKERGKILKRWCQLVRNNQADLAAILCAEMGKPYEEACAEIEYGAGYIEWFSEEAKRVYGDVIPAHEADSRLMVIKQPVGVVACITPWNFPNAMLARKVAPALAVGCAVVCKPAAETPLSALALCKLAHDAGLPSGLFSVVTSERSAEIGEAFCQHEKVRKLTFTGSTQVGRILLSQSADQIMKSSLELGGNGPFIVFNDADVDAAVDGVLAAKFRNGGQTCVSANRIYVQSDVYAEFSEKLVAAVNQLHVGDGFEPDVDIGPLISQKAAEKVAVHVEDAIAKGARILTGGGQLPLAGSFFEPTVIGNADRSMRLFSEETFGPVAPLFSFNDASEVVSQANDTIYGLAAYFFTSDLNRVWRTAEALDFGMIGINTGKISTEVAPFGGTKQSGLGREGSKYGCDDYLETKYLCVGGIA